MSKIYEMINPKTPLIEHYGFIKNWTDYTYGLSHGGSMAYWASKLTTWTWELEFSVAKQIIFDIRDPKEPP